MESTRRLRRDLGYEVAKLHGLQQTFERAPDDASAKALAAQIRVQAGACLKLLDDYQSSVGSRMWSDAERMCRPFRDQLRHTERLFRANAGEWDGTGSRPSLQRTGNWMWHDFYESTDDADAAAGDEFPDIEVASRVMVAPPVEAANHLHEDLDTLLALFDVEGPNRAPANYAKRDVMVAPPVPVEAHPYEDLDTLTALVDDDEPDSATAADATSDVMIAPAVYTEAHPREDPVALTPLVDDEEPDGSAANDATPDVMVAPSVYAEAHPHDDLDTLTPLVDDEEPDGATATDARPDVMVASPVPVEAHPYEGLDTFTPLVDDEEADGAAANDVTPDAMVAPAVHAEAHPQEDLDTLTPLVYDEEADGAAANDALRFTLPMGGGSAEQTLLVLVPSKTGLVYAHQYGGLQCRYAEIEGFLVPAWVNREARAALDRLFVADLGGNGVRDEDRSEAVKRVSDAVEQIWYRGTGDRMAPLQVDDARADELDEAWVPVLTPDGPAYLAWSNSD